jgi:uncharacterized protein YqeY
VQVRYRTVPLTEERLAEDLRRAMKARDMSVVYVLRGVITAVKNLKVEKRVGSIGEADLVQIIRREMRQREEAEDFAGKAGRDDLVAQNQAERRVLEPYVPAVLSDTALEARIREIASGGAEASIGSIMATLRAELAGRYDGRRASEIAKQVLAETGSG